MNDRRTMGFSQRIRKEEKQRSSQEEITAISSSIHPPPQSQSAVTTEAASPSNAPSSVPQPPSAWYTYLYTCHQTNHHLSLSLCSL